ncbi:hypothetical protein LJK88_30355 [Paenibacillus sp. P26]|nr:hypothetical protein LJK88_30355 [Paenibacillus sp. P26]
MFMFIPPMLLTPADQAFSDASYVYEPMMDGVRLILSRKGKETRIWTSDRTECTRQFPELLSVPVEGDVILDGGACSINPDTGLNEVKLVKDRLRLKKSGRIRSYAAQRPVSYVVWDILFYNGRDLRRPPLIKRRSILEAVMRSGGNYSLVSQVEDEGEALFQTIVERSMKGMVAKKKDSSYVSRPSQDWRKIMNDAFQGKGKSSASDPIRPAAVSG